MKSHLHRHLVPGLLATGLMTCLTTLWVFWGVSELFHEGWHYGWGERLFYLLPGALCLGLTLLAVLRPRAGGRSLVVLGFLPGGLFAYRYISRFGLSWRLFGSALLPILGLALVGGLFLWDAGLRGPRPARSRTRLIVALGLPLAVGMTVVGFALPDALSRLDDGDYGARLIRGEGVTLVWAPLGPGWMADEGPAWSQIALYGSPPPGVAGKERGVNGDCDRERPTHCPSSGDMAAFNLCLYLDETGTRLLETPQRVWRMPTTDEVVRSLVRDGEAVGCTWDGSPGRADCPARPRKETPLWIPGAEVIYYWTADEVDALSAYYVAYNGTVGVAEKYTQADYRAFRCVREP